MINDTCLSTNRPTIGITIGDPAGIGPEIVLKCLQYRDIYEICNPIVIASISVISEEAKRLNIRSRILPVESWPEPIGPERIYVVDVPVDGINTIQVGKVCEKAGVASYTYVLKAIELAQEKKIAAIATAPLTKESLKQAKIKCIDHTQIFSEHVRGNAVTLLATQQLRVAHVMRHLSLANSVAQLTEERVLKTIVDTAQGLAETYNLDPVKLIVAGLNPHNGDWGLMGNEEKQIILPAIKRARAAGLCVWGPIAADSAFPKAIHGEANAVIAMYHDQGHIAIKVNDWRKSYTVTVGLEIIRTSVNHGSALDIAGKGIADETSMFESICAAKNIVVLK